MRRRRRCLTLAWMSHLPMTSPSLAQTAAQQLWQQSRRRSEGAPRRLQVQRTACLLMWTYSASGQGQLPEGAGIDGNGRGH